MFIDGGEFAGVAELSQVYGAALLALDDINTYKNYSNFHALLDDGNYRLIHQNLYLRHGYAIFEHRKIFGADRRA